MRDLEWDSDQWREVRNKQLLEWVQNPDAVRFVLDFSHFIEIFDDFVDADKPVSKDDAARAVMAALYTMPSNPFFIAHRAALLPYMFTTVMSWLDSNELCKGDQTDKALAYTLKGMGVDVLLATIAITRGIDYARSVSVNVRKTFMAHQSFSDYCKEQGSDG